MRVQFQLDHHSCPGDALQIYKTKRDSGLTPGPGLVLAALKLCSKRKDLVTGRKIHSQLLETQGDEHECSMDVYVASTLVDMYAKCGSLVEARDVFESMQQRNVVAWNCIILGYAESGQGTTALQLFQRMKLEAANLSPTKVTFLALLKACVASAEKDGDHREWLANARAVHAEASRVGVDVQVQVANTLTDMYSKFNRMIQACWTLTSLPHLNVISWNCLIMGYANNRNGELALGLFHQMKLQGYVPDTVTYVGAIKSCAVLAEEQHGQHVPRWLQIGRDLHSQAVAATNNALHVYLASTLVDMYCKCRSLHEAWSVFKSMSQRSVVSWNCIILGYANNGEASRALELYHEMLHQRLSPDAVTFVSASKACSALAELEEPHLVQGEEIKVESLSRGRSIHRTAAATGFELHRFVASSLLDMYTKCGSMSEAEKLFKRILEPDAVCWTSMILGYAQVGEGNQALKLYQEMKNRGLNPDDVTYVAVLKACGSVAALGVGEALVAEIYHSGLESLPLVANSMVDFYGKCGSMQEALEVFELTSKLDVITWNSLLDGYSRLGDSHRVLELFECMQRRGVTPNEITFLCVLSVCCHGGLVQQGKQYFELMSERYGVPRGMKHYSCMVGLLGRANRLQEAVQLVKSMPYDPSSSMWMTLLGASWKWKNLEVGKLAFDSLLALEENPGAYVLMSNLYASVVNRDSGAELERQVDGGCNNITVA